MHCGSLPVSRSGTLRTTLTDRSHPRRGWFARSRSLIHFQSRPMSSFIVLKVVSFPFKWSPERSCSPLPFAYRSLCKCVLAAHRCNERRRVENIYWKGSGVFTESGGNRRWLPLPPLWEVAPLWERAAKWDSARAAYGRVMSHSMAAAPVLTARFYTVHISCKWAFTELVINLQ